MSTPRGGTHDSPRPTEPGRFTVTPQSSVTTERDLDYAESSASGSRRSRNSGLEDHNDRVSYEGESQAHTESGNGNANSSIGRSRHRSWRKGGFLLGPTTATEDGAATLTNHSRTSSDSKKGKRKSDDSGLFVRKQRLKDDRSSHGSSPLAKEIKHTSVSGQKNGVQDERSNTPSRLSELSYPESNTAGSGATNSVHDTLPPPIGFDSDPAQIVNMALALSEGRRRYFSSQRIGSADLTNRRLTSAGFNSRSMSDRPQGSLGQYLNSNRQGSRNLSPKSKPGKTRDASYPTNMRGDDQVEDALAIEDSFDVSEATYHRAENAKIQLELMFQYRRLLSHLPPLKPVEGSSRQSLGSQHDVQGRAYNPLQYVRNRKVRFREKRLIASELEGWHDLDKVRDWVDSVASAHNDERADPFACVRLPQLQDKDPSPDDIPDSPLTRYDSNASTNVNQKSDNTTAKPRRPRLDWVIYPGDLLADAFWLEQGLNKTKIEDSRGNKIYPADADLIFQGWSNRENTALPPEPPPDIGHDAEPRESTPPRRPTDLPSFRPASRDRSDVHRGRKGRTLRDSIVSAHSGGSQSRNRLQKLPSALNRSLSRSSSDTLSDSENRFFRGRRKKKQREILNHGIDSAALEKEMLNMLERDPDDQITLDTTSLDESPIQERKARDVPKVEGQSDKVLSNGNGSKENGAEHRTRDSIDAPKETDDDAQPRTSYDGDTTAPSSPVTSGFPSIAINLSPPASRSSSPTKKPLPGRINLFRTDRNKLQQQNGISATDFANKKPPLMHMRSASADPPMASPSRRSTAPFPASVESRDHSPFSKRASTMQHEMLNPMELRRTRSTIGGKGTGKPVVQDPPIRKRGMFKGGRIAELVGNEVSRVGDFIWKRDVPGPSHLSSPADSGTSDIDRSEDEAMLKTPPRNNVHRTQASPKEVGLSRQSTRSDSPQYHMSNLPIFTSPFKKDQEERDRKRSEPSVLAAPPAFGERRGSSRSDRSQHLAPPTLDLSRASSPDDFARGTDQDSRRSSYFGGPIGYTTSHDESGGPRTGRNYGVPVTGLNGIPISSPHSRERHASRPGIGDRSRSRGTAPPPGPVSVREVTRIRTLLLTSALKAREINRRANFIRDPAPKFLLEAFKDPTIPNKPNQPIPPVTRKEEHVYASKFLINAINSHSDLVRSNISRFHGTVIPDLHSRLQQIDDTIENTLTPRVRLAADSAGELSQSLTTTSTLAIKQLNDSVDLAIRRRRRVARLMRRAGYVVVEWIVVGILWWVWLVVMLLRAVRGVCRVVVGCVRWLLWI